MMEEVKRIDKNEKEITKTISYKLNFGDKSRFMASSLSNLVDNFVEGICIIKSKITHSNAKCEACELNTKIENAILNTKTLKMI